MFKLISSVCAAAMALSLPMAAPAIAMPQSAPAWNQTGIILAQGGGGDGYRGDEALRHENRNSEPFGGARWERGSRGDRWERNRGDRSERRVERRDRDRWERRADRRDGWGRGFERRGDRYYYRGHRGYRDPRPGYRQYQGWWFPPAAFIAGAIVGGALSEPPVRSVPVNAHVDWCHARYRSYRAYDNTFQPYNGPRRQCISPYS